METEVNSVAPLVVPLLPMFHLAPHLD